MEAYVIIYYTTKGKRWEKKELSLKRATKLANELMGKGYNIISIKKDL